MCVYSRMKNREAPFVCRSRVAQPVWLSWEIFTMFVKAFSMSGE
jgi:hypothetical protein